MCCLLALLFAAPLLLWRRLMSPAAMPARVCAAHDRTCAARLPRAGGLAAVAVAGVMAGALCATAVAVAGTSSPVLAALHGPICRALLPRHGAD